MTIGLRIVNEECRRSVCGSSVEQMTFGMPIGLRIVRIGLTIGVTIGVVLPASKNGKGSTTCSESWNTPVSIFKTDGGRAGSKLEICERDNEVLHKNCYNENARHRASGQGSAIKLLGVKMNVATAVLESLQELVSHVQHQCNVGTILWCECGAKG